MSLRHQGDCQPVFVDSYETRRLGRALKRHGWWVLLCALLSGLIGMGWSLMSPKLYRAEAVLLVNIQSARVGADGMPMDVELVPPVRRTVGTICQSDAVMLMMTARLAGEPEPAWPGPAEMAELTGPDGLDTTRTAMVRYTHEELYFDQLSQEMAALRAVDPDPRQAAYLANMWADICREMLVRAYGTTPDQIERFASEAESVRRQIVQARADLAALDDSAEASDRLTKEDHLAQLEALLSRINQRIVELKVSLEDSQQIARIVSPAAAPVTPINASLGLVGGLFALAGLLLGLAVALFRGA